MDQEDGRLSTRSWSGLPLLPETTCKIEVDTRLLLISSLLPHTEIVLNGEAGEIPRSVASFRFVFPGTPRLDLFESIAVPVLSDALDVLRDGP